MCPTDSPAISATSPSAPACKRRIEYDRVPRPATFKALKAAELEKDCVLSGGDDYELAFTAPREHRAELEALGAELKLPAHAHRNDRERFRVAYPGCKR